MRLRHDLNPADVYTELGPITDREARWLATLCSSDRDRWFGCIYGYTTSRYARDQYRRMTGTHP